MRHGKCLVEIDSSSQLEAANWQSLVVTRSAANQRLKLPGPFVQVAPAVCLFVRRGEGDLMGELRKSRRTLLAVGVIAVIIASVAAGGFRQANK